MFTILAMAVMAIAIISLVRWNNSGKEEQKAQRFQYDAGTFERAALRPAEPDAGPAAAASLAASHAGSCGQISKARRMPSITSLEAETPCFEDLMVTPSLCVNMDCQNSGICQAMSVGSDADYRQGHDFLDQHDSVLDRADFLDGSDAIHEHEHRGW